MGHCSCCAHGHGCASEKEIGVKRSVFQEYWKVGLSFILLIAGIVMNALDVAFFQKEYVALAWYVIAYLPVGIPVMKEAWESMKERDYFSEFTLMIVATIGAFYIGEYPEGVAVMLFYTVGELFQEKAVDKAKRNIGALLDVRPEKALVLRDHELIVESPKNIKVGEIIEVKAGERVPLDGTMESEVAAFNTAALTGESVPRNIRKGEEVLAGMIVTDKVIRIKVTRPFDKSALARILELVQNASERKAPAELFLRKFARVYTPIVIGMAVLIVLLPFVYSLFGTHFVFTFNDWLYRTLVFLVISCPCALVVSIPLGYFGGIGAASRLGILFKGGNYLDAITKINTVVFDKTGTLTKGTFEVQECKPVSGIAKEDLIRLIASVERNSTHPIAKAIVEYAKQQNVELVSTSDTREFAGFGLEATVDGNTVLVGNSRLLSKFNIAYPAELLKITDTVVVCSIGTNYAGYLLLADTLKDDAKTAIDNLKALNIENSSFYTQFSLCTVLFNIIFFNSSDSLQKYSEYPPTLTTRFLCDSGFSYASLSIFSEIQVICICIPPICIYVSIIDFKTSLLQLSSILKFKIGVPNTFLSANEVTLFKSAVGPLQSFPNIAASESQSGAPAFLPSGVAPIFLPASTCDIN